MGKTEPHRLYVIHIQQTNLRSNSTSFLICIFDILGWKYWGKKNTDLNLSVLSRAKDIIAVLVIAKNFQVIIVLDMYCFDPFCLMGSRKCDFKCSTLSTSMKMSFGIRRIVANSKYIAYLFLEYFYVDAIKKKFFQLEVTKWFLATANFSALYLFTVFPKIFCYSLFRHNSLRYLRPLFANTGYQFARVWNIFNSNVQCFNNPVTDVCNIDR